MNDSTNSDNKSMKEIQARLENNTQFKHFRDEIGISWKDFEVIDLKTNRVLKQGSREIGLYSILIDGDKLSISYDLAVERQAKKRLEKIGKVA